MTCSRIEELWNESLAAFYQYHHLINRLLTDYRPDLVPYLEKVLLKRNDMPLALVIVEKLSTDETKRLFPVLVQLATRTVPHTGTARDIVTALPRDWVLQNVEQVTMPMLERGDPEECRRVLELYSALDNTLLLAACKRLVSSGLPDLQTLAKEFMD